MKQHSPVVKQDLIDEVRGLLNRGALDLPLPGEGATAARHRRLSEFGRRDLSLGRLAEAHSDAVAILSQAGRQPRPGALYGVWAANRPGARLDARVPDDGSNTVIVSGSKAFCTGVTLCDAALVTASIADSDQPLLLDIDLRALRAAGVLSTDCEAWRSVAFAATATGTITLPSDGVTLPASDIVGPPGWYLNRPGFWQGALGPAAVWAGGALGLIDGALERPSDNPHRQAQLGALLALAWNLRSILDVAGSEIDRDPQDRSQQALARALTVRHLIERGATEALDRFGRATGPLLLAFDADSAQRHAELSLYIRQCHGESDLALLYRQSNHLRRAERP